jgi:hypothetical protein
MPNKETRGSRRARQIVPRIQPSEAAKLLDDCETLLSQWNRQSTGRHSQCSFRGLVESLDERVLMLALQPDSWGERARARITSAIAIRLLGDPAREYEATDQEFLSAINIIMPCLLLELGGRRHHIQVDFPANPIEVSAKVRLGFSKASAGYSISNRQLLLLAAHCGPQLVGLCFFGDETSRKRIESALNDRSAIPIQPPQSSV